MHDDSALDTRATADESVRKPLVDISSVRNVTDLLAERLRLAPGHIAFETRAPGAALTDPWEPVTTAAFMEQVMRTARGLIAIGVAPGDTVMIAAPTQYLWAVADCAALYAGAVVVPAYDTATPAQLRAIIADARRVAAFAGDRRISHRIAAAAAEAKVAVTLWTFDEATDTALSELAQRGEGITEDVLEERRRTASLDDIATIVYTSGTTGIPKGARITHRNLVGQVKNTAAAYSDVVTDAGNTILFLPLTHVLGRALQLICLTNGMRIAHLSQPGDVVQALAVLKPTFLVVVPRVLEKIQAAAAQAARQKHVSALWNAAVTTAEQWGRHLERVDRDAHARPSVGLRLRHALFDRVFFRRLRAVMGGRIGYLLSGAATLSPALALFFRGIGVPVIEGYGLTETTAPLTGGRPGSLVAGTVGPPLPGNAVRIADNGEVLARGVGVFAGYQNPEQTPAAFVDGYFRTGDLGAIDENGSLILHGRLKHIIITSTGRTISPEPWEQTVEAHPLVGYAALVGTDRPYLTGIVVLDPDAAGLPPRSDAESPSALPVGIALCEDDGMREEIGMAVAAANAGVAPSERAQYWQVITIDEARRSDYITPTLKLKRAVLLDALGPVIDALYR